MNNYSYLDHVEAEFLGDEEECGEEAEQILKRFFTGQPGLQSRAFLDDSLRYLVIPNGETVEILEEEGEWIPGKLEPREDNTYELICERNGHVIGEEIGLERAEEYFS